MRWATLISGSVEGWKTGEVVLKDDRVLIPFKREDTYRMDYEVAWDSNEKTPNGFSPRIGFVQVDLTQL